MSKGKFKGIVSVAVAVVHLGLIGYVIYLSLGVPFRLQFWEEAVPLLGIITPVFATLFWAALKYATEAPSPDDEAVVRQLFVFFCFSLLALHAAYVIVIVHGFGSAGFPVQTVSQAAAAIGLGETLFGAMLGYLFFHVFSPPPEASTTLP